MSTSVVRKREGSMGCWSLLLVAQFQAGVALGDQDELESIQRAIEEQGLRWTAGETSVSRLAPEDRPLGVPVPPDLEGGLDFFWDGEPSSFTEQVYFDWRNNGGNYVTPIRNQKGCQSCWIFAAVAAIEAQLEIEAGQPNWDPDLSEQELVSCTGYACEGGTPGRALRYAMTSGVTTESCMPYEADDSIACWDRCDDSDQRSWAVTSYARVGKSTEEFKAALEYGPLISTLKTSTDFYHYESGIYEPSFEETEEGDGHAILIVGWNDDAGAWICKNSWGRGWGEDSYGVTGTRGWFRVAYEAANVQARRAWLLQVSLCDCLDEDGDGSPGPSCDSEYCYPPFDCDDHDVYVSPMLPEQCGDGRDNDCDGLVDEDVPGDTALTCEPPLHLVRRDHRACGCTASDLGRSCGAAWLLLLSGLVLRRRSGQQHGPTDSSWASV